MFFKPFKQIAALRAAVFLSIQQVLCVFVRDCLSPPNQEQLDKLVAQYRFTFTAVDEFQLEVSLHGLTEGEKGAMSIGHPFDADSRLRFVTNRDEDTTTCCG